MFLVNSVPIKGRAPSSRTKHKDGKKTNLHQTLSLSTLLDLKRFFTQIHQAFVALFWVILNSGN